MIVRAILTMLGIAVLSIIVMSAAVIYIEHDRWDAELANEQVYPAERNNQ